MTQEGRVLHRDDQQEKPGEQIVEVGELEVGSEVSNHLTWK